MIYRDNKFQYRPALMCTCSLAIHNRVSSLNLYTKPKGSTFSDFSVAITERIMN